jgi:hypothetical protein
MAKKLFILISDGGDGSYYPKYTFNEEWISQMEQQAEDDWHSMCDGHVGCDGDGFHYDILMVPDECTLESLGVQYDIAER